MSFGFFIRGLTGLASKKQCIRMATNTGKELVNLMESTGRNLTKSDIDAVFKRTLPKGFAPKVITEREELIPYFIKTGHTQETAKAQAFHPCMGAGTIPNGNDKRVIFLPLIEEGKKPQGREVALYAHELEHALEMNHRLGNIFVRKIYAPLLRIIQAFNPKATELMNAQGLKSIDFEVNLQYANETLMGLEPKILNCGESIDEIIQFNGKSKEDYIKTTKEIIKKYADKDAKGSRNRTIFNLFKQKLNLEIPAYTVEGEIQKYALKLGEGETVAATGTAKIYEDTVKILKQEKKSYFKNLLRGKLSKPTVYQTDRDLFKLIDDVDDKKALKKYITGLRYQEKEAIFNILSKDPSKLKSYIDFTRTVHKNSNFSYRRHLNYLENISEELLKNPDIIKIAGIGDKYPEYANILEKIAESTPEKIAEFAKIAGEKTSGGTYKYRPLGVCLDHPKYETLKKIADTEILSTKEGVAITDLLYEIKRLEPSQIDSVYENALKGDIESILEILRNSIN